MESLGPTEKTSRSFASSSTKFMIGKKASTTESMRLYAIQSAEAESECQSLWLTGNCDWSGRTGGEVARVAVLLQLALNRLEVLVDRLEVEL